MLLSARSHAETDFSAVPHAVAVERSTTLYSYLGTSRSVLLDVRNHRPCRLRQRTGLRRIASHLIRRLRSRILRMRPRTDLSRRETDLPAHTGEGRHALRTDRSGASLRRDSLRDHLRIP